MSEDKMTHLIPFILSCQFGLDVKKLLVHQWHSPEHCPVGQRSQYSYNMD